LVTHIQHNTGPLLFAVYIDDIGRLQNNRIGTYVVMYVYDILLLAPSVTALKIFLWVCEQELDSIDMAINATKNHPACG